MFHPFEAFNPNLLIVLGLAGLLLGIILLLVFIKRRIFKLIGKEEKKLPGLSGSLRNLVSLLLLIAIGGMVLFLGFFFIAYHNFTFEEKVAIIEVEPKGEQKSYLYLEELLDDTTSHRNEFVIKGDQWVIEGDILKWEDYVNFLGLHTRYRLNRVRGRYIKAEDEISNSPTVHSLIEDEENFLWNILYDIGHKLPFVSTVYGNAAYQMNNKPKKFEVFVTTTGFTLREVDPE